MCVQSVGGCDNFLWSSASHRASGEFCCYCCVYTDKNFGRFNKSIIVIIVVGFLDFFQLGNIDDYYAVFGHSSNRQFFFFFCVVN